MVPDSELFRVGLTGGIATGKSLVLAEFEKSGVCGIDADRLAHRAIEKGNAAFTEIVREFGVEILGENGEIDRKKLGPIVFADPARREALNAIVHPCVQRAEAQVIETLLAEHSRRPLIVMTGAALLIETGRYRMFDRMVVVSCRPELQLARLMARDGMGEAEALQRIQSQMSSEEKVRHADYVIDTSGTYADTFQQVRNVYRSLVEDAVAKRRAKDG